MKRKEKFGGMPLFWITVGCHLTIPKPCKYGTDDTIQNTLLQNMIPWHIEYFKLKAFGKEQIEKRIG